MTVSVGDLAAQIDHLPDTARILVEGRDGSQYEVVRVMTVGTATDDPGLIVQVERVR